MRRTAGRSATGAWMVDLAVGLLAIAALVYGLRITGASFFWGDDLPLIAQSGSPSGLVEAYNDHLSVVILAVYRVLVGLFGFDYTPFRVAGMLSLVAIPLAYYATTRRFLTPPIAALFAVLLLWAPNVRLYPSDLNHHLALLGGIGCAAALNRGRRADGWLAGSLVFSLLSAGGGVAVGAACVVHNLATRPPLRRWLAAVVPLSMWLVWYLLAGRSSRSQPDQPSPREALEFSWDLAFEVLRGVALGSTAITVVLAVTLLAYMAWLVSRGLDAASNMLAWVSAHVVWSVGLTMSRWTDFAVRADEPTELFRYQLPTLGFLLLAVVPRTPLRWPRRLAGSPARLAGAAVLILALGIGRGLAVRSDLQASARTFANSGNAARAEWLLVGLDPPVVPADEPLSYSFGFMTAGQARELLERYGQPYDPDHADADRTLVEMGRVRALPLDGDRSCTRLTAPFEYAPRSVLPLYLWSADETWSVEARRFGSTWTPVASAEGGQVVAISLGSGGSDIGWEVRAQGACQVGHNAWTDAETQRRGP